MNSFHKVVAKAIEASRSPEEVSLQETEEKFSSLVLAFKTDRQTLDKRKELHLRARDIAEQNIQKELEGLKDGMKMLNQMCNTPTNQQTFTKVQHHIEVLEQSIARMSSRAEVHGAVQQELRVSQAIDVMVHHLENLKRVYEKEHMELVEARKTIRSGRQDSRESGGSDSGSNRSGNTTGLPQFRANRRRASISVISKNPLQLRNSLSSNKSPDSNHSRLIHRNSSFITPPLCFEEDNEESESTGPPRPLVRRKSSSIIEELPNDFLNQLQAAAARIQNMDDETKDGAKGKEEHSDEEKAKDKEDEPRDEHGNAVLPKVDENEQESDKSRNSSRSGSVLLQNSSTSLKRKVSLNESSKLAKIRTKIDELRERMHLLLKRVPRRVLKDTSCSIAKTFVLPIAFVLLFVMAFWFGWFHLLFRISSSSNK